MNYRGFIVHTNHILELDDLLLCPQTTFQFHILNFNSNFDKW